MSNPDIGRGKMILTAACPRTGTAWPSTGRPHEARGLKHRPGGTIRVVPIPPVLVAMLRSHLRTPGCRPGPDWAGPCQPSRAARILTPRAALRTVLPQDSASASSPTCSRLDEVGTKMSSSQPASANAAA